MTLYDVLGVGPSADEDTIHQAYVALARRHHPDRVGGDAERMRTLNDAWATLGDPVRRAQYDRALLVTTPGDVAPAPASGRWDDLDELDDDEPVRITVALPRWLSLLPAGTFAIAVGAFVVGLVMSSAPLLGLALMAFVLSCLFFLAAPFLALFASRRADR